MKWDIKFWTTQVSFYFDCKGFQYKQNPKVMERAPHTCEWPKGSEGLKYGCVAKVSKEWVRNANFMVL